MLRLLADKYQHVIAQFLLYKSLMTESHVSWMTVLHCYIMWFHKSRGTKNTIHIRACFFTWGKARGVPDGCIIATTKAKCFPPILFQCQSSHQLSHISLISVKLVSLNSY